MDSGSYGDQRIQPIIDGIDNALAQAQERGVAVDPAVQRAYEALKRDPDLTYEQLVRAVGLLYRDIMTSISLAIDQVRQERDAPEEEELVLSKIVHIERIIEQFGAGDELPDEPA